MDTMKNLVLAAALACVSVGVQAQAPTTIGCPTGTVPTQVDIQLLLDTTANCPLLEDKALRKLVDRFAVGTTFAYPAVPGTCAAGSDLTGTITPTGSSPIAVTGQTWSAQTLFPEAAALSNGLNPLTIFGTAQDGRPFMAGAAITVASIRSTSGLLRLDLVLSDRFAVDLATGLDTEDFQILGSGGLAGVTGKLTGVAMIAPGQPIVDAPMEIEGTICMK